MQVRSMQHVYQQGQYQHFEISAKRWYRPITTRTHAGIPYAVAHCQACFDLQGNGFCSQGNRVSLAWSLLWTLCSQKIKQISVALHIKTPRCLGAWIGFLARRFKWKWPNLDQALFERLRPIVPKQSTHTAKFACTHLYSKENKHLLNLIWCNSIGVLLRETSESWAVHRYGERTLTNVLPKQ